MVRSARLLSAHGILLVYESISLMENLVITEIYSIHYFEYTKDFVYEGESHDFWELLCVDNGVIEVTAGDHKILHKRNTFISAHLIFISPLKCSA